VFSMDGDVAPLDDLIAATRAHGGFLYVDEAHAAGVLGTAGMGLCVGKDVDMVLGTCGKGLGVSGAYVAGRRALIDWLITACAGFIYATALPPAVVAAVDVALDVVAAADAERAQVLAMAAAFRADMHALGLDTGGSTTQIVPVIIGSEKAALDVAAALKEKGFFVQAVRPPTVPPGTARLRVTITAAHTPADVAALAAAIAEIMAETQIKDTPDA
jgi:8-amino-7-oxononanoate synthase